jgi:hypothetical protein
VAKTQLEDETMGSLPVSYSDARVMDAQVAGRLPEVSWAEQVRPESPLTKKLKA